MNEIGVKHPCWNLLIFLGTIGCAYFSNLIDRRISNLHLLLYRKICISNPHHIHRSQLSLCGCVWIASFGQMVYSDILNNFQMWPLYAFMTWVGWEYVCNGCTLHIFYIKYKIGQMCGFRQNCVCGIDRPMIEWLSCNDLFQSNLWWIDSWSCDA